ncbi:hypothetical protein [Streptomyces sp. NPDC020362]|uniref:hypothetical protein n=1 Tax=unclassified Streptomyces TaxID=2593676 RepID=UPI00340AF05B
MDGLSHPGRAPAGTSAGGGCFGRAITEQIYGHLTVEDRTLLRFTAAEGADAHCHAGAQRHALARIHDWLDDRLCPARQDAGAAASPRA